MRTKIEFANLSPSELAALCIVNEATPDELTGLAYADGSDHGTTIKVTDESRDETDPWLLFGMEYGPMHLIRADSEQSAYEIFVDEQPTIEASEIHEAYNAFDKLVEWLVERGHENTSTLRGFANRWDDLFFKMALANAGDDFWDEWPLDEAYAMQSNSSGTGIVNLGHYVWYRKLETSGYTVKLSGEVS